MSTRRFQEGPKPVLTVKNSISGRFRQRSGTARDVLGTCSEHLKTLTGDLGGRELSSARRWAGLACRRAAPHRRSSGSAALRTPAWHWQLPAKEAAAARAPSPIPDAVA